MELFSQPEFWVAVAFVIFVVAVFKPAAGAITGGLDARAARIRQDLEDAARLRAEAEALLRDFEKRRNEATKEAAAIAAAAKAEAERLAADAQAELEAALKRREQLAMQRIAQAEASALTEVRAAAVDIAIKAAAKLIAEKLDPGKADALVDQVIADLPRRLN
jgi:F-type H+-transporting ATPase subunit b